MAWELNRLLPAQPAAQESRDEGGHTQCKGEQAICIKNLRPPATRWLMQPRLVFVKEALRAVPPSDLAHGVTTARYSVPIESLKLANQDVAINRPR